MYKMLLSDYLIKSDNSIIQAMQQIDKNAKGIVYVTRQNTLIGTITDGDIRRIILNSGNLNQDVRAIVNPNFKFLEEGQEKEAYKIMEQYGIQSVPIVNAQKEVIKIYFRDNKIEKAKPALNIPVVIMAGGQGTRLYPYTQILPKPLIPIGEKTITEHIMERFNEYGCKEFAMIVNYKKHFIRSYFEDSENGQNVEFVEEEEFLGTGGGLNLLRGKYNNTFFMTNCDILIEEDYSKILAYHRERHNIATMVCAVKNMTIPYGTVEVSEDGQITELKEKPELSFLTNTGFYILEPEFIEEIPQNTFIHITDIIQNCIAQGKRVGAYKIDEEKWLDMGQLEELQKMKQKLNVKE